MDSYYSFYISKNDHDSIGYKQNVEFTTFENIELLTPESGNSYEVDIGPGE